MMFPLTFLSKIRLVEQSFKRLYIQRGLSFLAPIEKPILYGDIASPPVRFAMMTASYLGIELKFHKIDLFCGENQTEFYTKINPLQKVPALAVNKESIIRDSHAIALYLCKISDNKELYPEDDDVIRAKVDEMLFFNASALFPLDSAIFTQYFAGKWPADEDKVKRWNSLLDYLEISLLENQWLAGDKVMLCDLCCAATVSSLRLLIPSLEQHNRVNMWLKEIELLPSYNINIEGLTRLEHFVVKVKK